MALTDQQKKALRKRARRAYWVRDKAQKIGNLCEGLLRQDEQAATVQEMEDLKDALDAVLDLDNVPDPQPEVPE